VDTLRRIAPLACGLMVAVAPVPPAAAAATSVTLHWTAPGDDGMSGRAQSYVLVRSLFPITAANFSLATVISGVPAPKTAGSAELFTVTNLFPNTGYYFAIKTVDDAGNVSAISNLAHYYTGLVTGVVEPASPMTSFASPWPNPARQSVHFAFDLSRQGTYRLDLFDPTGRHVRTLASGTHPAGRGDLAWDLRDASGADVRAGTYLVRADLAGEIWVRRLVVIR